MADRLRHLTQCCVEWRTRGLLAVMLTALACLVWVPPVQAQVRATYLYSLANFGGRLPYDWVRVQVDRERDETYVLYQNLIRIFNTSGMEVFSFGDDLDLGQIVDAVVDATGELILLSYVEGQPRLTRCDFRGEPLGVMQVRGLPDGLEFRPNRLVHRGGLLYFLSPRAPGVIVTDGTGAFREHIDLFRLLELEETERGDVEVFGFSVDDQGSLYFTIPIFFKAYKLTSDGRLTSFGRPGSAPGRFGVAAGIVADSQGRVLVADKLRCVVLVFDQDFNFLTEFGYRGSRPENLVVPDEIAIDTKDRVYVTQGRRRGVSVFTLTAG